MPGLKPSKPIALVQTGHTTPRLLQTFGDYDVWFRKALGLPAKCQGLRLYNVFDGLAMPTADELERDCSGVLITGSPSYVTEKLPWSVAIGRELNELVKRGNIPILGVCYGHQLLCDCTGGKVDFNSHGTSQGSRTTQLKQDVIASDPIFKIFAGEPSIIGHVSHSQVAVELFPGAVSLAHNEVDPNHAVRFGRCAWGTQFHPEFDEAIAEGHITLQREHYTTVPEERINDWLKSVRKTDVGTRLLARFVEVCAEKEQSARL